MPPDAPGYDHAGSFGRHAAAYVRHRPTYPDALFDWIAAAAPARGLAVDVATGGGQAALALAERFDRVIAIDQSPELLATVPAHSRLTTVAGPAEGLDVSALAPGGADVVMVAQALHWFATDSFWERVRVTTRHGGLFVAVGYAWFTVAPEIDAVLGAFVEALAPHWSQRNRLLFDGYRTLAIPFEEIEAPSFALTVTWRRAELLAYLGTWSAVTALQSAGHDVLAELGPRLAAAWPDDAPRSITMPLCLRAFRVDRSAKVDPARFVRAHTRLAAPPLVPEARLYLADEVTPLWRATEAVLGEAGLEPPFWAFAWPGSQAMARWILDHPEEVRGRTVLDIGAGAGLASIAAAWAGARVTANDIDPLAIVAARLNAEENTVNLVFVEGDLLDTDVAAEIVLVGDLCYERTLSERLLAWLRRLAQTRRVILAEPGRAFAPREGFRTLATYVVPTLFDLENKTERTVVLLEIEA